MGLGPDIWGPHGWKFLHFVTLGYPKNPTNEDKINYKTYLMLISSILPCSICSSHYAKNLKKYPITDEILEDNMKLFNWSVDMHNEVNILNGKKTIDYDTALNLLISNFKNENIENHQITHTTNKVQNNKVENNLFKNKKNDFMNYIILFFILVFIIIYLYYMKNKTI